MLMMLLQYILVCLPIAKRTLFFTFNCIRWLLSSFSGSWQPTGGLLVLLSHDAVIALNRMAIPICFRNDELSCCLRTWCSIWDPSRTWELTARIPGCTFYRDCSSPTKRGKNPVLFKMCSLYFNGCWWHCDPLWPGQPEQFHLLQWLQMTNECWRDLWEGPFPFPAISTPLISHFPQ